MPTPSPRSSPRRGFVLVYSILALVALLAVAALAVDYGRVQLVKTELQATADAAARHAVYGLNDGTAVQRAVYVAGLNTADGRSVTLVTTGTDPDVRVGNWNRTTLTFAAGGTPTNAIKVIARRTAARGGAVPLSFGPLVGLPATQDISVTVVAFLRPQNVGVVGLDFIKMGGNTTMSYWGGSGGTIAQHGHVATNGDITLSGSAYINGDARPGPGRVVYGGAGRVAGSTAPLASSLSYPNASPTSYAATNNNSSVPSQFRDDVGRDLHIGGNSNCTLPGGVYYFDDFTVHGQAVLNFSGPATVYCTGFVKIDGRLNTSSSLPANLKIIMGQSTGGSLPQTFSLNSNSATYATVYAPQSAVTLGGTGDFYGSLLGKSVNMTGTSAIYYDLALEGDGVVTLVQ